jgi:GNAT superfamily N-acetyltransferase
MMVPMGEMHDTRFEWRGTFTSSELNALHAEAFETRIYGDDEWNWWNQVNRHSLGWVVARDPELLVGFVNVVVDGLVHAWLQDTMVADDARGRGIGTKLVGVATDGARAAGYEWLHVDFEDDLEPFYFRACGFTPTNAGLIRL